mgnify:CR=1 FL=1
MTEFAEDELIFLPLGGSGEIGMNMNLYGFAGKWLLVDLGITFADGEQPGIEVITPDPTYIEERRDDLAGLILTHAHEDHLGAVAHLWPRLRCPVWATPFAVAGGAAAHYRPGRAATNWSLWHRFYRFDPFDLGDECPGHSDRCRSGAAYG